MDNNKFTQVPIQIVENEQRFSLAGLLPEMRVPRITLMVDFENSYIAMRDRGYCLDPVQFCRVLRSALQKYGEITASKAYADWGMLDPVNGLILQKKLADEGVDVIYLSNRRGKNTADMRIVGDIRDQLEVAPYAPVQFNLLALVSGDRDFSDVIRSVRERGKAVIVLGFRGSLSSELGRTADRVIYLDEFFVQQRVVPWESYASLTMQAVALANQKNGEGFSEHDLLQSSGSRPSGTAELKKALNQGILLRDPQTGLLSLNEANPFAKAVSFLVTWILEKLYEGLQRPGFTYVDTNYLVNGARFDRHLCGLGILGGRQELEAWLELLAETGQVIKKRHTASKDTTYTVNTWWPSDQKGS